MAHQDPGATRSEADDRSLGELVASIGETVGRLFRQEVALAKAETKQEVQKAGTGVALLVIAGAFALVALMLLSWMLVALLAEVMEAQWAYLLVGVAWIVVAGVLAMSAKKQFTRIDLKPERTTETLSEIPDTMRGAR